MLREVIYPVRVSSRVMLPCCPVAMKSRLGVARGIGVLVSALGVRHG